MVCAANAELLKYSLGEFEESVVLDRTYEDCPTGDFIFVRWPGNIPVRREMMMYAHVFMIGNHLVKYRFGSFVR